jgi:hypothetical protein
MAKIVNLGISNRKDSILELIFKGNGSNLEALLQNPNFSTPLWLIAWDPVIINAIIGSQTAFNAVINSPSTMNAIANSQTAMNIIINSQTALNTVINSQTAMNTIASSNSAINAILASSSALNTVISSQTAMNAIASSGTAMNAVINSQTALSAVRSNSTAWNIFINGKGLTAKEVPTMTSNTAPEGVASASSINCSNCDTYKAFDKSTSTYWVAGGTPSQWIQYQFASPVFIHTVVLSGYGSSGNNNNPNSITIYASTDGSSYTNIQSFSQEFTSTPTTLYIAKQGYYKYWRVWISNAVSNSSNPGITELNFKGFIQPT